jgi:hypothetical protein
MVSKQLPDLNNSSKGLILISIEYANKTITVKVLEVPTGNVSIQQSKDLYEVIEQVQYTE